MKATPFVKRTARKTKLLFRYIQPHINGWADLWDPDNSYESSFIEFETLLPLSPSFIILQHTKTTIFPIEYNFPTLSFSSHSTSKETTTSFQIQILMILSRSIISPIKHCFQPSTNTTFLTLPITFNRIRPFSKKNHFPTSQLDPNSNIFSSEKKKGKNK